MADIFLSYASEDRPRAQRVAAALQSLGWTVWWDRKIPAGRTFAEVIEEAISASRCVIVLWSKESVGSKWVREEADEGEKGRKLIPALLDEVKPPMGFRSIHAADLIGWEGSVSAPGFKQLVADLEPLVGPPPKFAEPPVSRTPPKDAKPAVSTDEPPEARGSRRRWVAFAVIGSVVIVLGGWGINAYVTETKRQAAAIEARRIELEEKKRLADASAAEIQAKIDAQRMALEAERNRLDEIQRKTEIAATERAAQDQAAAKKAAQDRAAAESLRAARDRAQAAYKRALNSQADAEKFAQAANRNAEIAERAAASAESAAKVRFPSRSDSEAASAAVGTARRHASAARQAAIRADRAAKTAAGDAVNTARNNAAETHKVTEPAAAGSAAAKAAAAEGMAKSAAVDAEKEAGVAKDAMAAAIGAQGRVVAIVRGDPALPPRRATSCQDAVQGRIAWDYYSTKRWDPNDVELLCRGASNDQPASCFDRVMHGGINWGGGTSWVGKDAVDLCKGTTNADATVACFQGYIRQGRPKHEAIRLCAQ